MIVFRIFKMPLMVNCKNSWLNVNSESRGLNRFYKYDFFKSVSI